PSCSILQAKRKKKMSGSPAAGLYSRLHCIKDNLRCQVSSYSARKKDFMRASTEKQTKNQITPAIRTRVALSFFAFIMIGANDGAFGVVLPSIQAHYHADKATIGLLFLTTIAGYLLCSFNNSPLLEKLA